MNNYKELSQELSQRVINLSPSQRVALAQQLSSMAPSAQRLVAYVVPNPDGSPFNASKLKDLLKSQLPNYMVPAAIVPLEALPRTVNGKIDVNALPEPQIMRSQVGLVAPRNAVEDTLSQVWKAVLRLNAVGIHDNFFELGGDSILSIQIVSKAREAGLRLAPNQLFEQPTIAELAAVVNLAPEVVASQAMVTGEVPLTPIQQWFFEQKLVAPHHWHQAMVVEIPGGVGVDYVENAIAALWTHHDALRLSFRDKQFNLDTIYRPQLVQIDLSHLSLAEQYQSVTDYGSQLHANVNLATGGLMRTALFTRGINQPNWLLLSVHHLVVDAVSWQILLSDLATLLGGATQLPEKTTSFKTWAETLRLQTVARQSEADLWFTQVEQPTIQLPRDYADSVLPIEDTTQTVTVSLSKADTQTLLHMLPGIYNTQINDALLTALAQTLLQWVGMAAGSVRIDVEAHGREQITPEIDISRTIGWFTTTYPVSLQVNNTEDAADVLQSVKEQLRQLPDRGIGYGMLRYGGDDVTRQRLSQASPSGILFNYLGQRDLTATDSDLPVMHAIDVGILRDPRNQRSYLLEVNAWVAEGQLQVNWRYDTQIHRFDTLQTLANQYLRALETLITQWAGTESSVLTSMDQQAIETIYPLTPLQQAFLWHSLQTSVQNGLIHLRCTLQGDVNVTWLQQAWKIIVAHHPVLRTSVHWEGVKQPLQVVARQTITPWQQMDWRGRDDQQTALADFLETDRDRSFDLTQPPISRLTLIRLSETDYELVWSCHHLMLDGWSGALVFNQLFDTYETLHQGQSPMLKPVPSYQTYVTWLQQQDESAAETFWQEALKDYVESTGLPVVRNGPSIRDQEDVDGRESITLSAEGTAKVQQMLRSHRLTLNTLIQGIWALLLHSYSGQSDVVFGATVSGRQGDLDGVESMVGMLINVLPVRVKIATDQTVLDWLQTLQSQQALASRYAYASLEQIQRWTKTTGRLFDSLLVIENYPVQPTTERSLQVDNMQSGLVSTYGLTIIVKPGDALTVMLQADEPYRLALPILLQQFEDMLTAITENPEKSVGEIVPLSALTVQPNEAVAEAVPNLSRDQLESRFFAPSNSIELTLTQIWKSVLGVSSLRIDDNFFDLGGNSLLAVQLFNQMQQQLDCALPLATLFQAPSVRQFAALLSHDQPVSQWSSLVPIQTSGDRIPLFFHGGSADALTWARFSHLLGTDRPFYALQRPDIDGRELTHTTVEALATDCIKEMRMVQPKGPYLVGGHCLGGAIAFEIAQQLQADGEDIVAVILIDSYRPGDLPKTVLMQLKSRLQLGIFWLRKNYYYHGGWEKLASLPTKIWQKLRPTESPLNPPILKDFEVSQNPIDLANSNNDSSQNLGDPQPKVPYEYRYTRAQKANELAAERYVPRPYAGQVTLFRAEIQILDWYFGRELGWQVVAKEGVTVTKIPGFFGNLFNQRSTPLLVEQVKDYLSTLN